MSPQSESSAGSEGSRPVIRSGDSISRRVLEDILKQTSTLNSPGQPIHPADLDSLLEVAKQYRDVEFQLDPIVIELVRVTLPRQLKGTGQTEQQYAGIANRVASTLFENDDTKDRLRSLWALLIAVEQ